MTARKINKPELAGILKEWEKEFRVLTPGWDGEGFSGAGDREGVAAGLPAGYRNTIIPGRAVLLPPIEELFRFEKRANGYALDAAAAPAGRTLIFGIRPCDARALRLLDRVFREKETDPYYSARRANTLLVGLGCNQPYESCFCTSLNGGPFDAEHVDLLLTDSGREFLVEVNTAAGEALVRQSRYVREASPAAAATAQKIAANAGKKITRRLDPERIRGRLAAIFENGAYWENIAAKCISCGICTLLCPTCHCFDICDEMAGGRGRRLRSPDSCSFAAYTRMPAENPREEKWRRLRNRISHKYLFYPMNHGVTACTGCGRCIRLCPAGWDITQVLNELANPLEEGGLRTA